MKAVVVERFCEPHEIQFTADQPKPVLDPNSKPHHILVRVLACAINPADYRLLTGSVSLVCKPKSFPYVPGLDVCGIVEEA